MSIDQATMSLRVYQASFMEDDNFLAFKKLLRDNPGIAEELALFHSHTHSPLKLKVVQERAAIMQKRITDLRQMGYKVGVNVLTTIGHHEENLPNSFTEQVTHSTDLSGGISLGTICPNDDRARDYIRKLYQIIAGINPDFIWLDDDIRFWHWPNGIGCFCDNCLSIFARETGTRYDRESLKSAFDSGTEEDKLQVRKAWLSHNRATMARLLSLVEETVHKINPGITLGQMTGDRFEEGYDFDTWTDILSGKGNLPVMWRPGGGFYRERDPRDMVAKSIGIARQITLLPDKVQSIQSEIERIPSDLFGKSVHMMTMEIALYIAAGATGAAINSFIDESEDVELAYPLLKKVKEMRPFYDLLARTMGRSRTIGIFDLWGKDSVAARHIRKGDWFGDGETGFVVPGNDIFETGLPATHYRENANVAILSGDGIMDCDGKEILRLLSRGVYLDANALERLNKMGYGEYTGFKVKEFRNVDSIEKLTEHPLNRGIEGKVRDARQGFLDSAVPAALLEPTQIGARSISSIIDYTPKDISPCSTGVFENSLGGRICVAGYYPWTMLHFPSKLQQLRAVARWLSRDTLPAYIDSYHRINLWVRDLDAGKLAITLINSHFDHAEKVIMKIRTDADQVTVIDTSCQESQVKSCGSDGAYMIFEIPFVEQWNMRLVLV